MARVRIVLTDSSSSALVSCNGGSFLVVCVRNLGRAHAPRTGETAGLHRPTRLRPGDFADSSRRRAPHGGAMTSTHPPELIPDDHVIVLFGATGDLARRKLLP